MIDVCARCGQVYLAEDNRDGSCTRGPHVEAEPLTASATRDWSHERLLAAFPELCPRKTGEWSRARGSASGTGRVRDSDTHQEAEVTLRIAPAAELVVRAGGWPAELSGPERERLEPEIVRGILNGLRLVSPPPLACEVSVSNIAHRSGAPAWLLPEATRRAFGDASGRCGWDVSIPFPEVAILPDESVDVAGARVVAAFQAAGFHLHDEGSVPASARRFVQAFTYFSEYAHVFFVCPHPWTSERTREFDKLRRDLSYSFGHDGISTVEHVLAAYPRG